MKPKEILTFTPVWQRPEIFKIILDGITRLKNYRKSDFNIRPFFIVSECWAAKMITQAGYDFIFVNNWPLGDKKNKGLMYALQNYKFEYLLEIGSDDLITNNYMDMVLPLLRDIEPQICGDAIYFVDIHTGRTAHYKTEKIFGAGRFIHTAAILKVIENGLTFWNQAGERGMDTYSWRQLLAVGVGVTKIELLEPCLLDIKSNININTIERFPESLSTAGEILQYFAEGDQVQQLINQHATNKV